MLKRLKRFLDTAAAGDSGAAAHAQDERQLAAAAVLVEAASLDGEFDDEERATIHRLLRERLQLAPAEADELLAAAEARQSDSVQIHRFTRAIVDGFSYDERVELIEMLWEVAYADGTLHDFEANLLRRVGGLIYVSDRDRGAARQRVAVRLNIT